ncbi:peptidase, putative [Plasmodium ovale wallikeri]|uniref:Peptidase, putative n=1 Tax=Plasmodium ovale wallikeri TaxID=864142 RepID=A0A1A8YTG9_PLAOA|nr:peptidase, putative [Plasmodium ovale wallikeri]
MWREKITAVLERSPRKVTKEQAHELPHELTRDSTNNRAKFNLLGAGKNEKKRNYPSSRRRESGEILCNKEKIYKISYIQDDFEMCNTFYDKEYKMYLSNDGNVGCLFCTTEEKLSMNLFKNTGNKGKFFLTCLNSVSINDIHKRFFFYESFCSFNASNTLLIYSAESDDIRWKKENNSTVKRDVDILKKLNNGIYTETFGEQFNYSFFYLYVYNLMNNTVKYVIMKDVSSCYYSPHFIDDTSFVCLSYRTVPYRLGIYAFNIRANDLYLCTLTDSDVYNVEGKENKNKKNYIRCAYVKLSGKNFKHTASPLIIREEEQESGEARSGEARSGEARSGEAKSGEARSGEARSGEAKSGEAKSGEAKSGDVSSPVYVACLAVLAKGEECKQHIMEYSLVLIKLVKEERKQKGTKGKKEKSTTTSQEEKLEQVFESSSIVSNSSSDEKCSNHNVGNTNGREDVCNYRKVEMDVLIKEGQYTPFFRGLYTNEIKGYCYPYIFMNTIFYCSKIVIAVHMFTKKIFRILIDNIYDEKDISTSVEILCMKRDNLLLSIRNMLLNDVLVYCIFREINIKGDFIYLTNLKSYNLDFATCDNIGKEKYILYSNVNDNSKKLFMILSEMETSLFREKHPYIRRKNAHFNLLYEQEEQYILDIQQKGLLLPNFNLFNEKKLRNLILYIHGGPYSTTVNEYKNVFIFFAACGFDVLCINYIGSLSFSDKPNILNGFINSIEIDDIMQTFKEFYSYFGDYDGVYLYGGSYGGFAACSILTKYNIFKSCCVINGVYEWVLSAYSSDSPDFFINMPLNKNCEHDCKFDNMQDYANTYKMSPLHFVENITTPILIVCSKNDKRVSYHNSVSLYNRLRAQNKKCKFLLFDGSNHSIDNYHHQETMLMNVILWFYNYSRGKK